MQVLGQSQNKRSSTCKSVSPRQVNPKKTQQKPRADTMLKKLLKKNERKTHTDTHIYTYTQIAFSAIFPTWTDVGIYSNMSEAQ